MTELYEKFQLFSLMFACSTTHLRLSKAQLTTFAVVLHWEKRVSMERLTAPSSAHSSALNYPQPTASFTQI